jgi:crotonobetainyl-CoA:carnitine CoA-transferase CaiB-like acyl-CoA transferase
VASEGIWKRFCAALGKSELTRDPRFERNSSRVANREALIPVLAEIFRSQNNESWLRLLNEAEVPCAPIQTIDRVFQSPQVLHRKMLLEVEHPTAGTVRMAGLPVKFSATPATVRLPPPLLGEHSEQVLSSWLGLSSEDVAKLKQKAII